MKIQTKNVKCGIVFLVRVIGRILTGTSAMGFEYEKPNILNVSLLKLVVLVKFA